MKREDLITLGVLVTAVALLLFLGNPSAPPAGSRLFAEVPLASPPPAPAPTPAVLPQPISVPGAPARVTRLAVTSPGFRPEPFSGHVNPIARDEAIDAARRWVAGTPRSITAEPGILYAPRASGPPVHWVWRVTFIGAGTATPSRPGQPGRLMAATDEIVDVYVDAETGGVLGSFATPLRPLVFDRTIRSQRLDLTNDYVAP